MTELEYTNVFELLTAVILSAQSTDAGVNRATRRLFFRRRHAGEDACARRRGHHGLHPDGSASHRNKARNVHATAGLLLERHGGVVPRARGDLESLPGVGRKTANVVLNVAFGEPTMAVDTHIFRVCNRTGLAPGTTPLAVETALLRRVPEAYRVDAHHWLILHGRYVCQARRPLCERCPVATWCDYAPIGLQQVPTGARSPG